MCLSMLLPTCAITLAFHFCLGQCISIHLQEMFEVPSFIPVMSSSRLKSHSISSSAFFPWKESMLEPWDFWILDVSISDEQYGICDPTSKIKQGNCLAATFWGLYEPSFPVMVNYCYNPKWHGVVSVMYIFYLQHKPRHEAFCWQCCWLVSLCFWACDIIFHVPRKMRAKKLQIGL